MHKINNFKIHKDKLFPKIGSVNLNNLKIDHECVSFVTPPYDAKKISEITAQHIKKYKQNLKDVILVDATACVGGDTIMSSSIFGKVIAIELNNDRYENLVHNVNQYSFTNIEVLNGDSTVIIPNLSNIDIINLDVPWGGKNYKIIRNLRLTFGDYTLEQFILNCFDVTFSQCPPKIMVCKLPKNYDMQYLYETINDKLNITFYDNLKKMNIIVIESNNQNNLNNHIIEDECIVKCTVKSLAQSITHNVIANALDNITKINKFTKDYQMWNTTDEF